MREEVGQWCWWRVEQWRMQGGSVAAVVLPAEATAAGGS